MEDGAGGAALLTEGEFEGDEAAMVGAAGAWGCPSGICVMTPPLGAGAGAGAGAEDGAGAADEAGTDGEVVWLVTLGTCSWPSGI